MDDSSNIRLHDVVSDWPHLWEVHGIGGYWNRALLKSGVCVAHTPSDDRDFWELLGNYRSVGVGPDRIIFVPPRGEGLYRDILRNPGARQSILDIVASGGRLDLFCASAAAGHFVRQMGVSWDRTMNTNLPTYQAWSDKQTLRQALGRVGFRNLFPSHHIVRTMDDLHRSVEHFGLNGADATMFKVANRASSEGIETRPHGESPTRQFIENYWSSTGLIVEAAYEHHPFSITFLLTDTEVVSIGCSLQWMGSRGDLGAKIGLVQLLELDMAHRGNLVGPSGRDLGPIKTHVIEGMEDALRPAMVVARDAGLRGEVCADCIMVRDAMSFLVELNPRTAHSAYVRSAAQAVSKRMGVDYYVLGANVTNVHFAIRSYADARARLPNLMTPQSGGGGVLMFHTPLLAAGLRKAGLLAIGPTFEAACRHFRAAEEALQMG